MRALLGTIVCKFGGDPATSVVEVAICAKFTDRRTDRQTDGRRTPRDCISSFQWNELIKIDLFDDDDSSSGGNGVGTI